MDNDRDAAAPSLQFDTVLPAHAPEAGVTAGGVTCTACSRAVADQYYEANGASLCEGCQRTVADLAVTPRGAGTFTRAALLGLVAAILGAVLYYAVLALANLEVGLIAIAIGYMVGYAIRLGTRGRGGRRFQVLALVLTYWAVGLAYTSVVFKAAIENKVVSENAAAASVVSPSKTGPSPSEQPKSESSPPVQPVEADAAGSGLLMALAAMVGFTFALPVLIVVNSLPGGLISAAIIAFGMQQAWRMTAAPQIVITGPYRIGAAGSSPVLSGADG
ncbi:MAG TPA: hypothetical protein VL263_17285 [Vicinamibacterales bacterium]|jgi:hypothetical protein|nr:hypothetical protein [Vicinamibacterales bacterium]